MASNVSKVYGTTLTLGVGQTAFASSGFGEQRDDWEA